MTAKPLPLELLAPDELARLAGLRYVTDEDAGYARQRNGAGFYYLDVRGARLRARDHVSRIDTLAIPPAWTDVWICRDPQGHLQATGRDQRQRKQYIYHERWREVSNFAKFWRMKQWVRFLPELRCQVARDLGGRGLTRNRVLAGMVALLDLTSIRIGNEEYVKQNNSYGLASLRTRHVTIEGRRAILQFSGKGGQRRVAVIEDKQLVALLKKLKQLPGAHVFQYQDADRKVRRADALAVNEYLRERTPYPFTAKDFRTWKASALAAGILYAERDVETLSRRKKVVNRTLDAAAEALANTRSVCRKYYVHAGLLEAYLEGQFPQLFRRFRVRRQRSLSRDEQILARFLRSWPPD